MPDQTRSNTATSEDLPTAQASGSSSWRDLGIVAGLIFIWLAATAWLRPLALPDEGRYVGVAWEMMTSGDWLTPTLDGLPFFHKPPLFYWITGASMSVFGLNEWAARAAPLFGAWLGSFAMYLFVRRWWNERGARLTLAALLVQPLLYLGGQYANLDMLVAGCITATIVLLAQVVLSMERGLPFRRALMSAYAMAALGFLAKGLIGFVIPGMVLLAWLALRRRWRLMLPLFSASGLLVFLLLTAPWFIAMQLRFPDFLDYFFVVQQFKRFAESGFNNVQPFWAYVALLAVASLPWLPWLYRQLGLRQRDDTQPGPLRLLMWVWVAVVVVFFSIPQSKLIGYVLPAVAPLAFLMADGYLSRGTTGSAQLRWLRVSVAVSAVFGIAVAIGLTIYPRESSRALAESFTAVRKSNEPLFMLNDYLYDLPFYARTETPIAVVNDWDSPEMLKHDDRNKELIDAGKFAPTQVTNILIRPASLLPALCRAPVSWVTGRPNMSHQYPFLAHAQAVFTRYDRTLWKLDRALPEVANALHCDEK
jgi:4-amino-4-deoxy-L-arabinose transferase-like glycosyltransferase